MEQQQQPHLLTTQPTNSPAPEVHLLFLGVLAVTDMGLLNVRKANNNALSRHRCQRTRRHVKTGMYITHPQMPIKRSLINLYE
jgi:hypothetical protein